MIGFIYTITNALGQVVKLNDYITDPANWIALQEYPAFDVDIKNIEVPKDGQHGIWDFQSYYGKRSITFSGVIVGTSEANVEDLKNLLTQVCSLPANGISNDDALLNIAWTDANGASWYLTSKISQSLRFSRVMHNKLRLDFFLTLKCADPVIRGAVENEEDGIRGQDLVGVALPHILPLTLGSTFFGSIVVNNGGTFASDTIVRLYGEASGLLHNPRILNLTTGQTFKVNLNLADDTKWIEIDSATGTVVDQDGTDRTADVDSTSDFVLLNPGNNTLAYMTDESDSTSPYYTPGVPAAQFTVKFRYASI